MPVNGIVIDSEYMPQGANVIVHHNSVHDVNRIFNYEEVVRYIICDFIYEFRVFSS